MVNLYLGKERYEKAKKIMDEAGIDAYVFRSTYATDDAAPALAVHASHLFTEEERAFLLSKPSDFWKKEAKSLGLRA